MEWSQMLELASKGFTAGDIGPDMAKFLLAWFIVKGTIKNHFKAVETGLAALTGVVGDLKNSVEKMELAHSARLDNVESEIKYLKGVKDERRDT